MSLEPRPSCCWCFEEKQNKKIFKLLITLRGVLYRIIGHNNKNIICDENVITRRKWDSRSFFRNRLAFESQIIIAYRDPPCHVFCIFNSDVLELWEAHDYDGQELAVIGGWPRSECFAIHQHQTRSWWIRISNFSPHLATLCNSQMQISWISFDASCHRFTCLISTSNRSGWLTRDLMSLQDQLGRSQIANQTSAHVMMSHECDRASGRKPQLDHDSTWMSTRFQWAARSAI